MVFGQKFVAAGGKAGIGERGEGDFGDRRIGIARREGVDDPSFPEIAHLTIAVETGSTKSGLSSAKIWVTKTVSSAIVAGAPYP